MSIRAFKPKDHLSTPPARLVLIPSERPCEQDPLRFWTSHPTNPSLVDLSQFSSGGQSASARWAGNFKGRPRLILQLAPALREMYFASAKESVDQLHSSLRFWWRLFDKIEQSSEGADRSGVSDMSDVCDLHRQIAFESGICRTRYQPFVRAMEIARRAEGQRPLHWIGPDEKRPVRVVPEFHQVKPIRDALKHRWYKALDRWERAEQLLSGDFPPADDGEAGLLANLQRFLAVSNATGKALPSFEELCIGRSASYFYKRGFELEMMSRGLYPDAMDIRAAFHLCLLTTGWNPATFLSLNVEVPFLENHPKDPTRYLLTGFKERSQTIQMSEGLLKCQRSPGVILRTLLIRVEPLRDQLRRNHSELMEQYEHRQLTEAKNEDLDQLRKRILHLEEGIRSPWLFVTNRGISWLAGGAYSHVGRAGYLDRLIGDLNAKLPRTERLPVLTATDFRDAFAAFSYQDSGGLILSVMRALGHKRLASTQRYLENNLVRNAGHKIFRRFTNAIWTEISVHGRLDTTIIAKLCQEGSVSPEERVRLDQYRTLVRSRIGIGCLNPTRPMRKVAPNFHPDGKKLCATQRCTLCTENAVIFPDSVGGLAMRKAELLYLQSNMPVDAFTTSSFNEELFNTEAALQLFDEALVDSHLHFWNERIRKGEHRPVHFEYMDQGAF